MKYNYTEQNVITLKEMCLLQGRIQDFPLGGRQPSLEGAPTSNTGTFR